MASKNPTLSRAVIDYARTCQHPSDTEAVAEAHGVLVTARIHAFIEKALATAPPLTHDQRARLARLLDTDGGQA